MSRSRSAIDGANFGMGQGRAQDTAVQHAGKRDINREAGGARDLGAPILPRNWFADDCKKGIRGQRRRLIDWDPPLHFAQANACDTAWKYLGSSRCVGSHDQAFRAEAAASVAVTTCG